MVCHEKRYFDLLILLAFSFYLLNDRKIILVLDAVNSPRPPPNPTPPFFFWTNWSIELVACVCNHTVKGFFFKKPPKQVIYFACLIYLLLCMILFTIIAVHNGFSRDLLLIYIFWSRGESFVDPSWHSGEL